MPRKVLEVDGGSTFRPSQVDRLNQQLLMAHPFYSLLQDRKIGALWGGLAFNGIGGQLSSIALLWLAIDVAGPNAGPLVVETSSRGEASVSRQLTKRFVANWQGVHPKGVVVRRDLAKDALPHVTMPWLSAYFTQQAHASDMVEQLSLSDTLVAELLAADELGIATPVYNYNIPASLKAWVDHIVRKGLTLGFDGKGLLIGKGHSAPGLRRDLRRGLSYRSPQFCPALP